MMTLACGLRFLLVLVCKQICSRGIPGGGLVKNAGRILTFNLQIIHTLGEAHNRVRAEINEHVFPLYSGAWVGNTPTTSTLALWKQTFTHDHVVLRTNTVQSQTFKIRPGGRKLDISCAKINRTKKHSNNIQGVPSPLYRKDLIWDIL